MRRTFARNIGELKIGDHLVLLYRNNEEVQDELLDFIRIRLEKNEKVLFFLGEEDFEESLEAFMRNEVGFQKALRCGQFEIYQGNDMYFPDQKFDPDRMIRLVKKEAHMAIQQGYSGLAVTGDVSGALKFPNGAETILEYEWKLNKYIFQTEAVLALCRYNIDRFDASIIKSVIELHKSIIYQGKIHQNPYYLHYEAFEKNLRDEYEVNTWLENMNGFTGEIARFMSYSQQVQRLNEKMFQNTRDAMFVFTRDEENCYRLVMANPSGKEMYGSDENLIGKQVDELFLSQQEAASFCEKVFVASDRRCEVMRSFKNEMIVVASQRIQTELMDQEYLYIILQDLRDRIIFENKLEKKNQELIEKSIQIIKQNQEIELKNQRLELLSDNVNRFMTLISGLNKNCSINEFFIEISRELFKMIQGLDLVRINRINGSSVIQMEIFSTNIVTISEKPIESEADDCLGDNLHKIPNYHAYGWNQKNTGLTRRIKESSYTCMKVNGKVIGGIMIGSYEKNEGLKSLESEKLLDVIATLGVSFVQNIEYRSELESTMNAIIQIIIQILEMHDPYTKGHSEHVARIARYLSEKMGYSEEEQERIYIAGLLHDIGKILLPTRILNKPGRLSDSEYERVREHAAWGHSILARNKEFNDISKIILHHHEKWNGTGYPTGLSENEIPIESQILAVADGWDAMISQRSYRPVMEFDEALHEITGCTGTQFSPRVSLCFEQNYQEIVEISSEYKRVQSRVI